MEINKNKYDFTFTLIDQSIMSVMAEDNADFTITWSN